MNPYLYQVTATHDYHARADNEISLNKGEIYSVCATDDRDYWLQSLDVSGNRSGWFPSTYVVKNKELFLIDQNNMLSDQNVEVDDEVVFMNEGGLLPSDQNNSQDDLNFLVNEQLVNGCGDLNILTKNMDTFEENFEKGQDIFGKQRNLKVPKPVKIVNDGSIKNVYLRIMVIEAILVDILPRMNAFIFRRDIFAEKGEKVFTVGEAKKTNNPKWEKEFRLRVDDPESEIVSIKLVGKKKYSKKRIYGEFDIALRSSARYFDAPKYVCRWYELENEDKEAVGKVKVFLQYVDESGYKSPWNVKRHNHLGYNREKNTFEVSDVPLEVSQLLEEIGVSMNHLKEVSFASEVYKIISDHVEEDQDHGVEESQNNVNSNILNPPVIIDRTESILRSPMFINEHIVAYTDGEYDFENPEGYSSYPEALPSINQESDNYESTDLLSLLRSKELRHVITEPRIKLTKISLIEKLIEAFNRYKEQMDTSSEEHFSGWSDDEYIW
eukprot:TRINITY_DN5772_c0_g1_i1.p1 TRINITY_DN5772_c0_g1~~TRINITY_DN5772_c0_g1_i1.p1  ORF type:complete len:496 (+),score=111.95 TRINITY_DN5772_c0_g1_i1:65-1552(+)